MAWIESHQSLSRHRKTLSLVAALRTDRHKVLGHLHELWWWGLDNADLNGLIGKVSAEVIADAAGWPLRQAKQFLAALISAGFVEETPEGLVLHNWYSYAGKLNQRRIANKERVQRARNAHVTRTDSARAPDNSDIPRITSAATRTLRITSAATGPDLTGPDLTKPEEPPNPPSLPRKGARRRRREGDEFVVEVHELPCGRHQPSYDPRCDECRELTAAEWDKRHAVAQNGVSS